METSAPLAEPWAREGALGPRLRRIGLLILVLASLLPYHGCRLHPEQLVDSGAANSNYSLDIKGTAAAAHAEEWIREEILGPEPPDGRWRLLPAPGKTDDFTGPWVFLAAPIWLLALLLVRGDRPRTRTVVGLLLFAALGILFLLGAAHAFRGQLDPSDPPGFGNLGASVALGIAGALLLCRPRARWGIRDVEATISVQALLGIWAVLVTPLLQAWDWSVEGKFPVSATLQALWANYRAGFWFALLGLALVAAPIWLRRGGGGRHARQGPP